VPKVVITLPAYRAERTLERTIAEIPHGVADRLILVDDASPDNTAQVARELGIEVHVHRQNLGYGGNQKTCYIEALASGADVVVLLHPDYQYEPKAVPLLIAPILAGDADMTFGSRFAGLGDPVGGGMPLYRFVGNRLTTIAENLMLGSRFTELHSGLRAYTRRCLLSLPILRYSNDFLFDSQLLIDAVTTGQRVVEVPIPTRYTKESSSIAIDRSLKYIAGTLGYCARTAILRGRRGRRARPAGVAPPAAADGDRREQCPACSAATEPVPSPRDRSDAEHRGLPTLRCTSCGLVSSRVGRRSQGDVPSRIGDGADPAAVLDALGAYYAPGNRLLVLGHDEDGAAVTLARERGWATVDVDLPLRDRTPARWPSERTETAIADAIVFRDDHASLPDAFADLVRAKSSLHLEGLLIVATRTCLSPESGGAFDTRYLLTRDSVRAVLTRAGFEIVEWVGSPDYPLAGVFGGAAARGEIVVARPAHRTR
jgi:Glycosyl transferase family 2